RDGDRATARERRIHAPLPRPPRGEQKKDEAIEDRPFAVVLDREQSARLVELEVGNGHLAGEDESHGTREESDQDEKPAEELQEPPDPCLREDRRGGAVRRDAAEPGEELLAAVMDEEEAGHHPEQNESHGFESVHAPLLVFQWKRARNSPSWSRVPAQPCCIDPKNASTIGRSSSFASCAMPLRVTVVFPPRSERVSVERTSSGQSPLKGARAASPFSFENDDRNTSRSGGAISRYTQR